SENELIDGVAAPTGPFDERNCVAQRTPEGPVSRALREVATFPLRPRRALIDPGAQQANFLGRQPFSIGGHDDLFVVDTGREVYDSTLGALSRNKGRPTASARPPI